MIIKYVSMCLSVCVWFGKLLLKRFSAKLDMYPISWTTRHKHVQIQIQFY